MHEIVGIDAVVVDAAFLEIRRVVAAVVADLGLLDLDDVGAQLRKLLGRKWPRKHLGKVENPDAAQRTGVVVIVAHVVCLTREG